MKARRLAGILAVLALLAVFLFLGLAARGGHVFDWDTSVWRFLHGREEAAQGSLVDRAAGDIVDFGGSTATALVALASIAVLLARRRLREALFMVATIVAILGLTPLFKEFFERAHLQYSFPSGHAAGSAAVVVAAMLLAWPTRFRWPALLVGAVLIATLGVALVYENWHLPSDVIGGWCLGIACATTMYWWFRPGLRPSEPRSRPR